MRPLGNLKHLKRQGERGAVAVEFAIMLPLLVIFFVGVVNYGIILREHQILQNAAREGARLSILKNYSIDNALNPAAVTAAIKARVVNYLAQEGITVAASDVTIDQNHVLSLPGINAEASRITVSYTRSLLFGNNWPFQPMVLTGEAIFRNFY